MGATRVPGGTAGSGVARTATGAANIVGLLLAFMFAPIAAIAAFVRFQQRLARRQVVGIALVVTGIGLLDAAAGASRIAG